MRLISIPALTSILVAMICCCDIVAAQAWEESATAAELASRYRQELAAGAATRAATLGSIAALSSRDAARVLAGLLSEATPAEHASIANALSKTGRTEAIRPLAELARKENANLAARIRATAGLATLPGKDATAALIQLADGANSSIARQAASSMGARLSGRMTTGAPGAGARSREAVAFQKERERLEKRLRELVSSGQTPAARAAAISAVDARVKAAGELGGLDAESWLGLVRRRIREESDPSALAPLVRALGPRAEERDLDTLTGVARHRTASVRLAAVNALLRFEGGSRQRQAVFVEATRDVDKSIREAAFEGLRGATDPVSLELAARALIEDTSTVARQRAGEVLAAANTPEATSLLLAALAAIVTAGPGDGTPASARPEALAQLADSLAHSLATTLDDEELETLADHAARATDSGVRIAAISALGHAAHPGAREALVDALGDRDPRVAIAAIRAIVLARVEGAIPALVQAARKRRVKEIVVESTVGLGQIGEDDELAAAYLIGALDHPVAEIVMTAIDACGQARVRGAVPRLTMFFDQEAWQLRSAAIGAMRAIRTRECIPPLLAMLQRETGKVLSEAITALGSITGKQLGTDPTLWQSWWDVAGSDFEVPTLEELAKGGELTVVAGTFYGIPVTSDRLVFVLDISGSMGATVQTAEGARARLDVAKGELTRVIQGLSRNASFNLIFFDHVIDSWQRRLAPATRAIRSEAIKLVSRQRPRGGTNIFDSVERAFADSTVDTIYLLTDGQPGSGRFVDPVSIRREVAAMNRLRRITIHCVAVGADNKLLRGLAEDSGGIYVQR